MSHSLLKFLLVFALLMPVLNAQALAPVYPQADWLRETPAALDMSPSKFDDAIKYIKEKYSGDNLAVTRRGYLLYAGSGSKKTNSTFSCTKSYTSTVLGLLVDDNKLSVNSKPSDSLNFLKSKYSRVEYRHLATMTSGYDAKGGTYGPHGQDGSKTPFTASTPRNCRPRASPGSKPAWLSSGLRG